MVTNHFPHLQRPIAIGGITLPNRLMFTTHGPRLSQARYLRYIAERARGGVALMGFNLGPLGIMQFPFGPGRAHLPHAGDLDSVPPHPLSAEGKAYYDSLIPMYRAWVEEAHRNGAKCIGQLYHSGAAQHTDIFQPVVAPSAVPDEYERHNPHPLTTSEIADLIEAYAISARRAMEAGYDGVELHAAHGYLGHQFLSPLSNRRDDAYGGSLENRLRFLVELMRAVRYAVGAGYIIGVRLNGPDRVEGGLTLEEVVTASQRMAAESAAYISISGGTYSGLRHGANLPYVAPAFTATGPNVATAAAVRRAVAVPVIVAGRIADFDSAEKIVADGDADMVGMVRALIADPSAIAKSFSGRGRTVIPCIGCNECHYGRPVACATNPAAGREAEMEIVRAEEPKRVLVVGAGPAGLECAIAAARRGHHVTLVDRRNALGGMLVSLANASEQASFGRYLAYARQAVEGLPIDVRLGCEADPDAVRALAPDVVVLATGATHSPSVAGAIDPGRALEDASVLGERVVVAGGLDDHLPPLVVADFIARTGRKVTLLTDNIAPGQSVEPASLYMLLKRLLDHQVEIRPFTAATVLDSGVLAIRNSLTNTPGTIEGVDSLVAVGGRVSADRLAAALREQVSRLHLIGDALAPRRMLHATLDGARLGLSL